MKDRAGELALFLLDKTGSIFGQYVCVLSPTQQREMFGYVIGKGEIVINGETETVCYYSGIKGDKTFVIKWGDLPN